MALLNHFQAAGLILVGLISVSFLMVLHSAHQCRFDESKRFRCPQESQMKVSFFTMNGFCQFGI